MSGPRKRWMALPLVLLGGGAWWWLDGDSTAVQVSAEDLHHARTSGLGAADVVLPDALRDGDGPVPESLGQARALPDVPARRAALDALEALLAEHPEQAELLVVTAELERWLGEDADALEHARAGAEGLRDRSWAHYVLARSLGDELRRLGRGGPMQKLQAAQRFGGYRESLETAVALDRTNVPALKELILVLGMTPAAMGGDRERARELCAALEAVDPMQGILSRARLHSAADEVDEALACCARAAERFPDSTEPPWIEGSVLLRAERPEEADAALSRVLEGARDETWYQAVIARARLRNDRGEHADEVLADMDDYLVSDPAFEWSPPLAEAHLERGRALARLERPDEAREAIERALGLDPELEGAREALDAVGD